MRNLNFRKEIEFKPNEVKGVITELDRIKRDAVHAYHKNTQGRLYTALFQKVSPTEFRGHLAGADTDKIRKSELLNIKFKVKINSIGVEQITLISSDRQTTAEESMVLIKHSINNVLKKLDLMPYENEEFSKNNWKGYFFSYAGNRGFFENFDEVFSKAIAAGLYPVDFKQSCIEMKFNIEEVNL